MSTIYFWKPHDKPYGIFCQWYDSPFRDSSGKLFHNAEQYMMYQKALLFNDTPAAKKILENSNPKIVKQLGRLVANFSDSIWDQNKSRIAYEGNLCKFKSKEGLKQAILGTKDRVLVEASPFDRIWGIGYKENEAEGNKKRWGLGGRYTTKNSLRPPTILLSNAPRHEPRHQPSRRTRASPDDSFANPTQRKMYRASCRSRMECLCRVYARGTDRTYGSR